MSVRGCTFLPSQNHGHGAAKAARPMAALPHPCTNFAAASVHGAECCRSGELKEQRSRQRVVGSIRGLKLTTDRVVARGKIAMAQHGVRTRGTGSGLREKSVCSH